MTNMSLGCGFVNDDVAPVAVKTPDAPEPESGGVGALAPDDCSITPSGAVVDVHVRVEPADPDAYFPYAQPEHSVGFATADCRSVHVPPVVGIVGGADPPPLASLMNVTK